MKTLAWIGLSSLLLLAAIGCTTTTTTTTTEEWIESTDTTEGPQKTFGIKAAQPTRRDEAESLVGRVLADGVPAVIEDADPIGRNAGACMATTTATACIRCCALVSGEGESREECAARAHCADKIAPTENDCRSTGCGGDADAGAGEGAVCLRCWAGWTCVPVGGTC